MTLVDGIRKPEELIRKALNGDIPVYRSASKPESGNHPEKKQNPIYRHLMNGVSFMVPFIVREFPLRLAYFRHQFPPGSQL